MPTVVLSPGKFREEAERRLIDRYGLMQLLSIRSREVIKDRVDRGQLPEPVFRSSHVWLWDLDEVHQFTDRKE